MEYYGKWKMSFCLKCEDGTVLSWGELDESTKDNILEAMNSGKEHGEICMGQVDWKED